MHHWVVIGVMNVTSGGRDSLDKASALQGDGQELQEQDLRQQAFNWLCGSITISAGTNFGRYLVCGSGVCVSGACACA